MASLRIMSNNVWWCDANTESWAAKGQDCSTAARVPGLVRLYQETQPDIIGLQECSSKMSHTMMPLLAQSQAPYALLWGRDTPIAYRKDKFELVDSEFCCYPEEIPGLEGSFNNLNTKSFSIAVLRLKETGQLLIFATTHLWYMSENPAAKHYQPHSDAARTWQLNFLMDRLDVLQKTYNCPVIFGGDLNTYHTSAAVQSARARGFVHAHDVATGEADDTTGMHYCYGDGYKTELNPGNFDRSIDHILVRGNVSVESFIRYCPDYYFPLSDHSPVWIDVTF